VNGQLQARSMVCMGSNDSSKYVFGVVHECRHAISADCLHYPLPLFTLILKKYNVTNRQTPSNSLPTYLGPWRHLSTAPLPCDALLFSSQNLRSEL
jgi:hypothetical protein